MHVVDILQPGCTVVFAIFPLFVTFNCVSNILSVFGVVEEKT